MLGVGLSLTGPASRAAKSGTSLGRLIASLFGNGEQGAFFVAKPKVMRQQVLYQSAQEIGPDGEPLQVLELDGTTGTYASTPHSEAVDITGDITLVAKVAPDSWAHGPQPQQTLIAKRAGTEQALHWRIEGGGSLRLMLWYDKNENTSFNDLSADIPGVTDGATIWLASTASFLEGECTVKSYVSQDGVQWTQIGETTFLQDSIETVTTDLTVGAYANGSQMRFNGNIYRAQVYSGAGFDLNSGPTGTLVADFNAEDPDTSDRSWQSSTSGETWTLHGNATIGIAGTPALEPGDPVGVMLDLSGNAKQARQFIAADRPTLQAGDKGPHLFNDGINKSLLVNLPDLGNDATLFYANKSGLNLQGRASLSGELDVLRGEETYLFGIVDRALTSQEERQLRRLLEPKHGGTVPAMVLDGTNGTYASTPHSDAVDITGDLTLVAKIAPEQWVPGRHMRIMSKGDGSNKSFLFTIFSTGAIILHTSEDGGTWNPYLGPNLSLYVVDGEEAWVAVSLDADNGAGGSVAEMFLSFDGKQWTTIGQIERGATSIRPNTEVLEVGALNGGSTFSGKIYRAQVYSGAGFDLSSGPTGTLVADFNPSDAGGYLRAGESFTSSTTGEQWTLHGNAMFGEYPA